ncbi:MAG: hypothetical protein LBC65_05755, partial [Oscillospiraceae bacterium]|nr:hypothetical protein [Oscillospiraceae bacterium]
AAAAIELAVSEVDKTSAQAAYAFTKFNADRSVKFAKDAYDAATLAGEPVTLIAPISGFVGQINHVAGSEYSPGMTYCRIFEPHNAKILIDGNQLGADAAERLSVLKYGAAVTIHQVRGDGRDFTGYVSANTTLIGSTVRVDRYAIIEFDDADAFGEYALENRSAVNDSLYNIRIAVSDINDALLIPRTAIQRENTYRYVYVVEDGMPKKRFIRVGLTGGDDVQVLDGLQEGDVIVAS